MFIKFLKKKGNFSFLFSLKRAFFFCKSLIIFFLLLHLSFKFHSLAFIVKNIIFSFINVVDNPVLRSRGVRLAVLVKLAFLNKSLFSKSSGTDSPPSWVCFSVHDDSLSLSNGSVVARSHLSSRHLSDSHSYGLALRRHNNDFFSDFDSVVVPQDSWQHQFCSETNRVH